jgi:hypothetical protein
MLVPALQRTSGVPVVQRLGTCGADRRSDHGGTTLTACSSAPTATARRAARSTTGSEVDE